MSVFSKNSLPIVLLLTVAAVLRLGVVIVQGDRLREDRDAYLALAQNLADGRGYALGEPTPAPTAFRPPLYPLILAGVFRLGGGSYAIGLLHLLLGTATVWLTLTIGRNLRLGRAAYAAAALVVVDPLSLQYTAFAMTETMFTFLVAVLLALLTAPISRKGEQFSRRIAPWFVPHRTQNQQVAAMSNSSQEEFGRTGGPSNGSDAIPPVGRQIACGLVLGLCCLCRPTMWAFGLLLAGWWLCTTLMAGRSLRRLFASAWCVVPLLLSVALTVSPWLVRNVIVFGKPILTTTHGGYTLLLGNNPVFYREVVMQPLGTVWDGDSLDEWTQSLESAMRTEGVSGEIQRDRWMSRRAWQHIFDEPGLFFRACLLRLYRFWNVVPLGPAAESVPVVVRWGVGFFYGMIALGMLAGISGLVLKRQLSPWMPILLLLLSFTLVHTLYWSNARMRAPLIPAIAVLAVAWSKWGVPLDKVSAKNERTG